MVCIVGEDFAELLVMDGDFPQWENSPRFISYSQTSMTQL
jgi:hypothetical protein